MEPNPGNSGTRLAGRDIVIIGLQPWYYELGSNCKNIAQHFAKTNRVLYVNMPINRKTFLSRDQNPGIRQHCEIIRTKGETIRPIGDTMWEFYPTSIVESINGLPSNKLFSLFNYFNNRRFARDIRKALNRLQFKDFILFNDDDIYNGFYLKELLRPALYVYYMRDFLQGYDYWRKHTSILEPKLIKKADVALANSLFYAEYCKARNPESYYIGQGCNFDLFNRDTTHQRPPELQGLTGPLIGYVGAVDTTRLDIRIIEIIATAKPSWNIVLVGPEDAVFAASTLHHLPNVLFTGRRPLASLPAFVEHFDVCLNPQLINTITKGNYPLKIDEYLAMGRPVVATRTPTMKLFEDYTWLADKPEDYPALIEAALRHDSAEEGERRIAFAREHTWENSMKEAYKIINNHLTRRP